MVKDGDSWARTRRAFGMLLEQWGDGATLASQYIGGQSVSRDHKADKDARDPIVPVAGRQAARVPQVPGRERSSATRRSSSRRPCSAGWEPSAGCTGATTASFGPGIDISVLERILGIQKIVLGHCLSAATLARLQNQQLQADPGADPLRMEEVFRSLTDGIWSDLDKLPDPKDAKAAKIALSTIRRNLQREYLRRLSSMVLGDRTSSSGDSFSYVVFLGGGSRTVPADARALARLHLKEIAGRIGMVLETKNASLDDTSRAHLEECQAPDRQGPRGQSRHQGALSPIGRQSADERRSRRGSARRRDRSPASGGCA